MATVEIKVTGGSRRTEIRIERVHELDAATQAVGLLLSSYGDQLREAMERLATVVKVLNEHLPAEEADRG